MLRCTRLTRRTRSVAPFVAAAPFSPLSLSPTLWLKADAGTWQLSTLSTAASADGDRVGGWADQSGNGNNVLQATVGKRGTLKLAIQNGKPVVRFDGVSNFLMTADFASALAQPFTWFLAFLMRSGGNVANILIDNNSTGGSVYLSKTSAPAWDAFAGTADRSFGTADTAFHIMQVEWNGASTKVRIDGGSESTLATPGAGGLNGLTLAALRGGGSLWTDCDFGEVLVVPGSVSVGNKTSVFNYLNGRWGAF